MPSFTVTLDPSTAAFYGSVARRAGRTEEQVLADALFKLAGELSLEALCRRDRRPQGRGAEMGENWN
ncbi:MAG: hypothetical protein HFF17_04115 [Oscillospiraceae bacterium]|nr:hypothetical protein [Oscillospiraceae bacterium]